MTTILSPRQALNALGLEVTIESGVTGALGQPQVRARAFREDRLVAITIRDDADSAEEALYKSVTMPARRTRRER